MNFGVITVPNRATYLQSSILDTTISQVRMDTADEFSRNSPPASLVEECRCPAGYMGLSCDVIPFKYSQTFSQLIIFSIKFQDRKLLSSIL